MTLDSGLLYGCLYSS